MKQLKKISIITCVTLALCLSIFSFSRISLAEQNDVKNCVNSCEDKKQVCMNMNADTRLCEAQYQDCATTCKVKSDTSAPKKQEEKGDSSSTTPQKLQKDAPAK
jgi:hypothetical protein